MPITLADVEAYRETAEFKTWLANYEASDGGVMDYEEKALAAVERGEVVRVYRERGPVFMAPADVSSTTLYRAERRGLIAVAGDGTVSITPKGENARKYPL